jgi:Heavy metal binding domain
VIDRLQLTRPRRAAKAAVVIVTVAAAALVLVFRGELAAWVTGDLGAPSSSAPTTFYTCSMDPSVESDHPGTCPICGMALTPVSQQERSSGVVRVAARARALIGLDVAPVQNSTLRKRIVATGEVVEPAPGADRVAIAARVYRGDASQARSGESVVVTARDVPLMQFTGTVVEPAADTPGTLRIVADNPEQLLRPGMIVEVKIEVELAPRLAVPSSAVLYAGKRRLVFVERSKGIFEPRTPELGISSDGLVEVVGGLKEGEQVAISGTFLLGAESRIRSDGTLWGERPEPVPIKPPPPPPRSDTSPSTGW